MLAQILGPDGIIIAVVVVVVLLFGGRKLPQLFRGMGSASHEFKKGLAEGDGDETTIVVTAETTEHDAALGIPPVVTHAEIHHPTQR